MIDLSGVTAGCGLDVRAELKDRTLAVVFSGSAEMEAVRPLEQVVARLHTEAAGNEVAEVHVDLRRLEYMTATCFKCLVTWIGRISELAEPGRYTVHFRSSTDHLWQRRSLDVLKTFATDLVFVETV